MSEFIPNESGLSSALTEAGSKNELPNVGDTMYILSHEWGGHTVLSGELHARANTDVIVVEVKAIKKVKLSVE